MNRHPCLFIYFCNSSILGWRFVIVWGKVLKVWRVKQDCQFAFLSLTSVTSRSFSNTLSWLGLGLDYDSANEITMACAKKTHKKQKFNRCLSFTGWVLRSENLYHTPFYSPCPLAVMSHIYIEKEARKKNPFSWLSGWRVTSQAPSNVCLVAWNGATVTTPLPLWKVHLFSIWCSSCTKRAERSERRLSPSLSLSWAAADTLPLLWAIEKRKEKKKLLTPTENVMWTQGCPAEKSYQIKPYYLFLLSSNDKAAALYQQLSGSV